MRVRQLGPRGDIQRESGVLMQKEESHKQYQAVIFNLYGTLVESSVDETQESAWTALRTALYDEGADYVTNERLRTQFQRAKQMISSAGKAQDDDFEPDLLSAYEKLFDDLWIETDIELSKKVAWTFRKAATKRLELVPGAMEMLRKLKAAGKRVVLLSNSQACYTRPELKQLGLDDVFDDVIIASDEGVSTASSALYERVLDRLGMTADDVLMVSNDESCDVRGAREAGIDAILLNDDVIERIGQKADREIECEAERKAEREAEREATRQKVMENVARLKAEAEQADETEERAMDAAAGEFAGVTKRPSARGAAGTGATGAAGTRSAAGANGTVPAASSATKGSVTAHSGHKSHVMSVDCDDYHQLLDLILQRGTSAVAA